MSNDAPIRFAVVGCGHIGKRHAAMIEGNKECELVALCDVIPKENLSLSSSDVPFYGHIDNLLASDIQFDVLSVATPNGLHEEHAIKGLKTGHHVLIEKPMALTKEGCERIIFESLNCHKHVFCVMQNRYSPSSIWLKDVINQKLLGEIYLVQINCYWNRNENYYKKDDWHGTRSMDGGTLFTQFSHFVDIMFWLFGDIHNIQTRFNNFSHKQLIDFEDSGIITFDFVREGMGSIHYSTSVWNNNFETSITILGQNGTVKVGGQYMNEVEYCNIKDYTMPALDPPNPPNDYGAYKGSAANHHYIFENVVEVLKGRVSITTNALEGLKVVEIIEKIYGKKSY